MDRIATATALEDLDAFQEDLMGTTVTEMGIEAPRLGRTRRASDREGETRWNTDRTEGRRTRRFYVAVEVLGDITLTALRGEA